MHPALELRQLLSRRLFFGRAGAGLGSVALASLLEPALFGDDVVKSPQVERKPGDDALGGLPGFPNFPAKAKRV
ncbi:MAG: sulfatase, partial [Planctomycetia bacterium]|nr:sulfatase [Planctomycetia bacterium]